MKDLNKKLSKKLNLTNIANNSDIIKAWQKIAKISNKKLIKNSLIYKLEH